MALSPQEIAQARAQLQGAMNQGVQVAGQSSVSQADINRGNAQKAKKKADKAARKQLSDPLYIQRQAQAAAQQKKNLNLAALGEMRAPTMDPANEARIKALEAESKQTSLVEDPEFQAARTQAVQGGQQALSGIQNAQAASGGSGGFSNQGSLSDVYDRLGGQLSQLGQQSYQLKNQKRDAAAEARQSFLDEGNEFANQQAKLRAAIQSGAIDDVQASLQALRDMQEQRKSRRAQILGGAIGAAGAVGGALLGGPAGAAVGSKVGGFAGNAIGKYSNYA